MRTKAIVKGFKNSQKFRFFIRQVDVENSLEFAMVLSIQDFFDKVATNIVRHAVQEAFMILSTDREIANKLGREVPNGLVTRVSTVDYQNRTVNLDVQLDLY